MGLRAWNAAVLVVVGALWLVTGTHTEKAVIPAAKTEALRQLEAAAAANPTEENVVLKLAQAYLDNKAPGLAVTVLESSPDAVRAQPTVEHLYARALLEQGRNREALAAEERVLAACEKATCAPLLETSATRRVLILGKLVEYGVEDSLAEPDLSTIAYQTAVREAHAPVRIEGR